VSIFTAYILEHTVKTSRQLNKVAIQESEEELTKDRKLVWVDFYVLVFLDFGYWVEALTSMRNSDEVAE